MEEKKAFVKIVTEWIFQQSIGVIMAVFTIGLVEYQNWILNQRVQYLEQRMESMLTYEREVLKEALDKNTRALEDFITIQRSH